MASTSIRTIAEFERKGTGADLPTVATLAGWSTPDAHPDMPNTGTKRENGRVAKRLTQQGLGPQALLTTGWATPAARDYRYPNNESYQDRSGTKKGEQLNNQAVHQLSGWDTPTVAEADKLTTRSRDGIRSQLIGKTGSPYPAPTAGPAGLVLNPAMSRWLTGFPSLWDRLSPGFDEWAHVQELIASGGSEVMGTPLFPT